MFRGVQRERLPLGERKNPFANRSGASADLRKGVFALSNAEGLTALLRSGIIVMKCF